jgi:hypothetical protein
MTNWLLIGGIHVLQTYLVLYSVNTFPIYLQITRAKEVQCMKMKLYLACDALDSKKDDNYLGHERLDSEKMIYKRMLETAFDIMYHCLSSKCINTKLTVVEFL